MTKPRKQFKLDVQIIRQQKQMSNPRGKQVPQKREKQFSKSGCELSEFPIIKLHIFSDIQVLNLSNNIISDLSPLEIHNSTSLHTLAKLKVVDLSKNQFPSVASLLPLSQTAKSITVLNIADNPLVNNLNFLYEIALTFTALTKICCDYEVLVDSQVRPQMIKQQLVGGRIMCEFLEAVKSKTDSLRFMPDIQGEVRMIESILEELETPLSSITEQNDCIFQQMDHFINFSTPLVTKRTHTYGSPQVNRRSPRQIEAILDYEITKQSNQLKRYLTDNEEKAEGLNQFYYRQLVFKKPIYAKILQEIEVEEELLEQIEAGNANAIPFEHLLLEISRKWGSNFKLTNTSEPEMTSNHASHAFSYSPFKSVQTDFTSRVERNTNFNTHSLDNETIYFGLDREWTQQTHKFVKHRLLSLLRSMQKQQRNGHITRSPINAFQSNQESRYHLELQKSNFTGNEMNYQTFGPATFELADPGEDEMGLQMEMSMERTVMSPKSKNKFIIGSLMNILQHVIKTIVFRRIFQTKLIREVEISYFDQSISKIIKKNQEAAFRKIFEAAIFYECLMDKMAVFKKRAIFKAWKQLKKRKLKLLKAILSRKNKKEKAFLSVFLTQLRINTRNVGFSQRIRHSQAKFLKESNDLQDVSAILKRSTTIKQLPSQQKYRFADSTMQIKRTFFKPSQLK